jgi:hypothetical protein
MEKMEIIKVKKLGDLINLLTEDFGSLYTSHEYSNGETDVEFIDWKELMSWLCRPKGMATLARGTHTGNCVGDETASIAVSKIHGMYFVTKKWSDEEAPRLLKVISANDKY